MTLYGKGGDWGEKEKCLAAELGNSLDLFHVLLYGVRCRILCIGADLMTGQVERFKESGRGRCGCKDMAAGWMKGAGPL